jgi:hypothetical protein
MLVQKLKAFLRREQELDALDEGQHKRPLEEGEETDEPAFKKQAPKELCRVDIERNLRSRENLLVLPHKDFSNCIQLFAEAEKKYTDKIKHQDGKVHSLSALYDHECVPVRNTEHRLNTEPREHSCILLYPALSLDWLVSKSLLSLHSISAAVAVS